MGSRSLDGIRLVGRALVLAAAILSGACALAAGVAPAHQPGAAAVVRPSTRLLHELAKSQDLKAFTASALTRPAEGGYFYARYVAGTMCGHDWAGITSRGQAAVRQELRAGRKVPAWRHEMMRNLPRRCSGFAPGEAIAILADLRHRPDLGDDPLLAAERELLEASPSRRPGALRQAVLRLMRIDDPLLWTERRLWDRVAQSDALARGPIGYFFDGRRFRGEEPKFLEVALALELGFCRRGLPCAPDDELRVVCASGGACAPDRYAKSRRYYLANGGTAKGWPRVLALASRVRYGVRSGNVAMFVR